MEETLKTFVPSFASIRYRRQSTRTSRKLVVAEPVSF